MITSSTSGTINNFDWSSTPLGPIESWPISLKVSVNLILGCKHPMQISWGPSLIQIYNDAQADLREKDFSFLGRPLYETWADFIPMIKPLYDQVLKGESLHIKDYIFPIKRDGKIKNCHFDVSLSPLFDDEGKIVGILSSSVETTKTIEKELNLKEKQKISEEQRQELHNIFMQAPMPLIVLEGEEFRYVLTNPPYDKFLGKSTHGKTVLEVFSKEEIDHFLPLMTDVYNNGVSHIAREQPFNYVDEIGHFVEKWIDVGFYPLHDIHGKIKGQFVIITDITDAVNTRKQVEKDLVSRDEFISIASHEFKTPVSSLKLQFQMIERNLKKGIPLSEESFQKMLNLSLRQIDGLARLIEDLLDATKASNERMNFKFIESDISVVVNDAINNLSQFLSDHETLLEAHVEAGIKLYCDPFRIEQVVTNLLTNASKYGDYKPISLHVKDTPDYVSIMVKDSGIGISKENHGKIFERFQRGNITKNYAGLGLGLFITKHIVNAHRGTIELDSKPGMGSTFTVRLPKKLNTHGG